MNDMTLTVSSDVGERLKRLFKNRLNIEIKDRDALLFGSSIGLSAIDLVYICFDMEKEFGITIDDECIENHLLTTFSNIEDFLLSKLEFSK